MHQPVVSFDWNYKQQNRMLAITSANNVKDVKIFERIAVVSFFLVF